MIITLTPAAKSERRVRPAFGQEAATPFTLPERKVGVSWGIDGGGPIDPHDTPCRPGPALFAGGPPLPAHAWRELRGEKTTAAQRAYLRRLGIADTPRDKDQAGAWIDEAVKWKALVT